MLRFGDTARNLKCYATGCGLRASKVWPKWMLIRLLGDYFMRRRLAPQITLISGARDRFELQAACCILSSFENVSEQFQVVRSEITAAHPGRCCCQRFRSCESLHRSCSAAPGSPGHSEVSGWRPDRSPRSTRVVLHREDERMNHKHTNKAKSVVFSPPVWVWCWQWDPLHLWGQMHLYWLTPSTQVPPFWQGLLAHSLATVDNEQSDHCSQLSVRWCWREG